MLIIFVKENIIYFKKELFAGVKLVQYIAEEFRFEQISCYESIINYKYNLNLMDKKKSTLNEFWKKYEEKIKQKQQKQKQKQIGESSQIKNSNNEAKKEEREERTSQTQKLSNLSAKSQQEKINVEFYLNKNKSCPNGQLIETMLTKWHDNYELLERNHAYIQWLFPNSFKSRFNPQSHALSASEAEQFRTNPEIASRYVRSYEMMLGFYGMKLKNKLTGELTRSRHPDYKERYYKTFLTSFHNHMRITRILCSLCMTGFTRYAKQLSIFLDQEINSEVGGLKSLQKYNVYKDWEPYKNSVENQESLSIYFKKLEHSKKKHDHNNEKSNDSIKE